jgi:hypothetical protein
MDKSKVQVKSKKFKFWLSIAVFVFCSFSLSGCAGFQETVKGFKGVSTKVLEDNLKDAAAKEFKMDYKSCYYETKELLKGIGAYIYAEDTKKKLIAVYVSEQDTTPVGLFFKEIDKNKTQIRVSSPSSYAKELISETIFSAIDKSLKEKKVNVQLDVAEESQLK